MSRPRLLRTRVFTVLALALVGLGIGSLRPADAALTFTCTSGGTLYVTPLGGGIYRWQVNPSPLDRPEAVDDSQAGSCIGDPNGGWTIRITGEGTSNGLGLCGGGASLLGVIPLPILVSNLDIDLDVTLTNAVTSEVKTYKTNWNSPVTTFPLVTPFLMSGDPGGIGVGVLTTRIAGACTNDGLKPATEFVWTSLLPGAIP